MTSFDAADIQQLVIWRDMESAQAEAEGSAVFLGIPDRWYDYPTWGCPAAHISRRILKRDCGDACLFCGRPAVMVPPGTTEADLRQAMSKATGDGKP
jgi:hypothetical protein